MSWPDDTYAQTQQLYPDPQNVQIIRQPISQQPTTVLQQIPSAVPSPVPAVRPGHVKEDLVELMMIQNTQMHQVIMNNMTMSALSAFGYSQTAPGPETLSHPVIVDDEDPEVYHHHYPPASVPTYPGWMPLPRTHPRPTIVYQDPVKHQEPGPSSRRDRKAVPPPPPPSATGTVGADVPPAAVEAHSTSSSTSSPIHGPDVAYTDRTPLGSDMESTFEERLTEESTMTQR